MLREIGVDTGGSNVQFAVCPKTGRILVIEMNPRVSRSSHWRPKQRVSIAKIAAQLAVGYRLDELVMILLASPQQVLNQRLTMWSPKYRDLL